MSGPSLPKLLTYDDLNSDERATYHSAWVTTDEDRRSLFAYFTIIHSMLDKRSAVNGISHSITPWRNTVHVDVSHQHIVMTMCIVAQLDPDFIMSEDIYNIDTTKLYRQQLTYL